jgi:hypothetical protein
MGASLRMATGLLIGYLSITHPMAPHGTSPWNASDPPGGQEGRREPGRLHVKDVTALSLGSGFISAAALCVGASNIGSEALEGSDYPMRCR